MKMLKNGWLNQVCLWEVFSGYSSYVKMAPSYFESLVFSTVCMKKSLGLHMQKYIFYLKGL